MELILSVLTFALCSAGEMGLCTTFSVGGLYMA